MTAENEPQPRTSTHCTCRYLNQLTTYVFPESHCLPRLRNFLSDTTWNIFPYGILACACNMQATDLIENNYSKKRCTYVAVCWCRNKKFRVVIKTCTSRHFLREPRSDTFCIIVIRCTAFSVNALSRHVLLQCWGNGFHKNVTDIWTSKLWVSLAPSNYSQVNMDCWHRECWYLVMVEKRLYIQSYFCFHSWNYIPWKRRWPQTFVRCVGDTNFFRKVCVKWQTFDRQSTRDTLQISRKRNLVGLVQYLQRRVLRKRTQLISLLSLRVIISGDF